MKKIASVVALMALSAGNAAADEILLPPTELSGGVLAPWIDIQISAMPELPGLLGVGILASYIDETGSPIGAISNWNAQVSDFDAWDGVLVAPLRVSDVPKIFHKSRIEFMDRTYNATLPDEFRQFKDDIIKNDFTAINLPLLILDGRVDVKKTADASKAIRHLAFQMDSGAIGLFQTSQPVTIYEAANALMNYVPEEDYLGKVRMAVNLPTGAEAFCLRWEALDIKPCAKNGKTPGSAYYLTMYVH